MFFNMDPLYIQIFKNKIAIKKNLKLNAFRINVLIQFNFRLMKNIFKKSRSDLIPLMPTDISRHFLPQKISFKGVAITLKDIKIQTPMVNKTKWFAILTQDGILGPKSIITDDGIQIKFKEREITPPGFIIPYTDSSSLIYFITSQENITKLNQKVIENIEFENDVKKFLYPIKSVNKPLLIDNNHIPLLYKVTPSVDEAVFLIKSDNINKNTILFNMVKTGIHAYVSSLTPDMGNTKFNKIEPIIENYNNIINNISLIETSRATVKDLKQKCDSLIDLSVTRTRNLQYSNEISNIKSIKTGSLAPTWHLYQNKLYDKYNEAITQLTVDVLNQTIYTEKGILENIKNLLL